MARVLLTISLALTLFQSANGIVRRDDVDNSVYIDLGAAEEFEAVGYWDPANNCANGSGGTLIHPEWVITAAHCIPGSTSSGDFLLGPSNSNPTLTVAADDWFRNPSYNGSNIGAGHDFGLIRLSTPIMDVTPAQLYRSNLESGATTTVIGYGRTGTGLTGQQNGTQGTKRGATNRIDGFGPMIGAASRVFVGDFDNPNNSSDGPLGPGTPTANEGMIALQDSGGGWFIEVDGLQYLAGVSSFTASNDGSTNSDYGDIFGAGRIGQSLTWIDGNANVAVFWNGNDSTWNTNAQWDAGAAPTSTSTAVVREGTATVDFASTVEYLFVDYSGAVNLDSSLTVDQAIIKRGGTLAIGANSPSLGAIDGNYQQTADGILNLVIHGPTSHGLLSFSNGTAEIDGHLQVGYGSGYQGPETRGQVDEHVFLFAVTSTLTGQFDDVDGIPVGSTMTYVGESAAGEDGLFRSIVYNATQVTLNEYLALPGDANGDGSVDSLDFDIWVDNRFTSGTDWLTGDFNNDGATDLADLNIWNNNKYAVVTLPLGASVPEPASGGLALLGLLAVLQIRRSVIRG